MVFCILKSILAWAVLVLVSGNLIAFAVRGFARKLPTIAALGERLPNLLELALRRMAIPKVVSAPLGFVLCAAYLSALYRYWNVGLVAAASMVMVGRLPDLVCEIRTGTRVSQSESPGGPVYYFGIVFVLCALPVTWYSLCVVGGN